MVDLSIGPKDGVTYPVDTQYCGNCTMPIEVSSAFAFLLFVLIPRPFQYCEYYPEYEKCKGWLEKNLPTEFEKMKVQDDSAGGATEDDKKRQKRGGKGNIKTKKCKDDVPKKISVFRAPRSKKKSVTVITGLSTFDVDLKVAAKAFGAKFACGASVTGDDEIVVQGDVKDELFDFIPEKWPEVGFCCGMFEIYNYLPFLVLPD